MQFRNCKCIAGYSYPWETFKVINYTAEECRYVFYNPDCSYITYASIGIGFRVHFVLR